MGSGFQPVSDPGLNLVLHQRQAWGPAHYQVLPERVPGLSPVAPAKECQPMEALARVSGILRVFAQQYRLSKMCQALCKAAGGAGAWPALGSHTWGDHPLFHQILFGHCGSRICCCQDKTPLSVWALLRPCPEPALEALGRTQSHLKGGHMRLPPSLT